MSDENFFQKLISEFGEYYALASAAADRDEQAERHIAKAEYELAQAHRALTSVLHRMQSPDGEAISSDSTAAVDTAAQTVPADDAVAA